MYVSTFYCDRCGREIRSDTGGGVRPCSVLPAEERGCRVALDLCDPCCREMGLWDWLKQVRAQKPVETLGETVDRVIREIARESVERSKEIWS